MKQKTAVICLSPINGGMELASIKIAQLISENIQVEIIVKKNSFLETKLEILDKCNIKLHSVSFSTHFSLSLIKQLRAIFIKSKIKNIIFLGASEMKSLYFATLGLNINFIVRQGTTKSTHKKDIIHKLLYSNVNYFVGNSDFIKKNILKILPFKNIDQVKRIYASVKLNQEIKQKEINGKLDILHIGRITTGKGQLECIQACEVLYNKKIDFYLRFLGSIHDQKYFLKIQSYLQNSPFKDKVEFIGFTNNIQTYLNQSDIFLFPTYGEGMSNAIIEALSAGLISIVYNNTSTPEFKDLGFHIHLTKENNVENLQQILLNIAHNFQEEKQKAKGNHKKALRIFAPSREKEEYLNLLI